MSRVGKKPIPIPNKTKVACKDRVITVEGEKGKLTRTIHDDVNLDVRDNEIRVTMEKRIPGGTRHSGADTQPGFQHGHRRQPGVRKNP